MLGMLLSNGDNLWGGGEDGGRRRLQLPWVCATLGEGQGHGPRGQERRSLDRWQAARP